MHGHSRGFSLLVTFFFIAFLFFVGFTGPETNSKNTTLSDSSAPVAATTVATDTVDAPVTPPHLAAPDPLHGIYITAWTAGSRSALDRTLALFDGSILNAVVIDIKDASGRLSYAPVDSGLLATGVGTRRIRDLPAVIDAFHARGIYVIGRLSVFQDPFYAALHPEDAFLDTRTGATWTDYKHTAWLRPDSAAVTSYATSIALDAYAQGFDEINFDYVRFPSDGELKYLDTSQLQKNKADTMEDFFTTVYGALHAKGIPVSADVFGLTMSAGTDIGIGQKAVLIAPSVDKLAPMLYPSHFWDGSYGVAIPATEPYVIIHTALTDGIAKLAAAGIPKEKLRPWLQDFDLLGVPYTPDMVEAQIKAAADLGIDSWVLWDPTNLYTKEVVKTAARTP